VTDVRGVCWCGNCQHALFSTSSSPCPECGGKTKYLTTDARPVFARERRILEFYGHTGLNDKYVWKGGKNNYYYIDGKSVALPSADTMQADSANLAAFIASVEDYSAFDLQIADDYYRQFAANSPRRLALEDEAARFIDDCVRRFPDRDQMVSFSGGKDSTVVSDLTRKALGNGDILHIFSDTGIEDENTYNYVRQFQEENPEVPFFWARSEHDFFELAETMGPPSRGLRWCCTIFKAGPISDLIQSIDQRRILTFYGIRHSESHMRSEYHKLNADEPDRYGKVVKVNQGNDDVGITIGAKIGQQAAASPIIDWFEFDVWNYILSHRLSFNKSYELGFSRVGCWLCPMNSRWSNLLSAIFFPEDTARWRNQLIRFAKQIDKPDPEEYVDSRSWVSRHGRGFGIPGRSKKLTTKACGDRANAVSINVQRPIDSQLAPFLVPLGKVDPERSRPKLGEVYLKGRPNQKWTAIIVQAPINGKSIRFTVIEPKLDMQRLTWYFRQQATKFQACIRCTACASVCPQGAIVVKPDAQIYQIDADRCTGCMECVTHFDAEGCLAARSMGVPADSQE
jgi:phosphoadenosine phosphosulfate reductase